MAPTIADLHIHGRFSRACSKDLSIANLELYARKKGIHLLGTGDFTHPLWIQEIKKNLKENDDGTLVTKTGYKFLWTTEISLVYTQERGRRIHLVIFAPDGEVVKQITDYLLTKGRIDYDGRPIFKIPCPEFVEALKAIDKRIEIIPAHAWTPWFSLFGSKSGFDTIKECFADQTKHIYAIETGISSDPPMNWRLSQLDKYTLVSFSDSHSFWPWRLGREATLFDKDISNITYDDIIKAIRTKKGLVSTIEVDPNYGKYHVDGHRACGIIYEPSQTKKAKGICPRCKKPLTIGVLGRTQELADRPEGYVPKKHIPFVSLMPLHEILSSVLAKGLSTKTVKLEYDKITKDHPEFEILMSVPFSKLTTLTDPRIAQAIVSVREGKITIDPGYDGVYGKVHFNKLDTLTSTKKSLPPHGQKTLN